MTQLQVGRIQGILDENIDHDNEILDRYTNEEESQGILHYFDIHH